MDENKEKEISTKLQSKVEKSINEAILAIREDGNPKLLTELFGIYEQSSSAIKTKITDVFNDLKDQKIAHTIIDLLQSTTSTDSKKMLLSACWQSRLDYIDYLETFIDTIMTEDFEMSFEAFTVIENLESKVLKERKDQLIQYTEDKLSECKPDNQVLSHDIIGIIEQYEEL